MAARRLLAILVPFWTQPPPSTCVQQLHVGPQQQNLFVAVLQTLSETAESITSSGCPRPQQGGQRINEYWLHDLPEQDCLWRFR